MDVPVPLEVEDCETANMPKAIDMHSELSEEVY